MPIVPVSVAAAPMDVRPYLMAKQARARQPDNSFLAEILRDKDDDPMLMAMLQLLIAQMNQQGNYDLAMALEKSRTKESELDRALRREENLATRETIKDQLANALETVRMQVEPQNRQIDLLTAQINELQTERDRMRREQATIDALTGRERDVTAEATQEAERATQKEEIEATKAASVAARTIVPKFQELVNLISPENIKNEATIPSDRTRKLLEKAPEAIRAYNEAILDATPDERHYLSQTLRPYVERVANGLSSKNITAITNLESGSARAMADWFKSAWTGEPPYEDLKGTVLGQFNQTLSTMDRLIQPARGQEKALELQQEMQQRVEPLIKMRRGVQEEWYRDLLDPEIFKMVYPSAGAGPATRPASQPVTVDGVQSQAVDEDQLNAELEMLLGRGW